MVNGSWWSRMSTGVRTVVLGSVLLVGVLLVLGWVVLLLRMFGAGGDAWQSPAETSRGDGSGAGGASSEELVEDPGQFSAAGFVFERDEYGMVRMPVTTDPAEAAAAAAAIAWNVDYGKRTRQQFFDEAVTRMTRPSPDYQGPVGEVHTFFSNRPFEEPVREYEADPKETLLSVVHECGLQEPTLGQPCMWWLLAIGEWYDWRRDADVAITGEPILVMSEGEMMAWDPSTELRFSDSVDVTPDTPGATLTHWYVLTEAREGRGEYVFDADLPSRVPLQVSIWCDAPADGGLCGVAYMMQVRMPNIWPLPE